MLTSGKISSPRTTGAGSTLGTTTCATSAASTSGIGLVALWTLTGCPGKKKSKPGCTIGLEEDGICWNIYGNQEVLWRATESYNGEPCDERWICGSEASILTERPGDTYFPK